jgi:predicted TIM-barrel fold metal-dependent hydrolase
MKTKRQPLKLALNRHLYNLKVSVVLNFQKFILYSILITIFCFTLTSCKQEQTYVRPAPKKGFEKRIKNEVYNIRIINTHEHLSQEQDALNMPPDINVFFKTYQVSDMISSGMGVYEEPRWLVVIQKLESKDIDIDEKWDYIKDVWEKTNTTAFGRAVLISIKDLYGIDDLNENTYKELCARIEKVHKKDYYYDYVLREKARIDLSIQIGMINSKYDPKYFRHLFEISPMVQFKNFDQISNFLKEYQLPDINTLADLEKAIESAFQLGVENGAIGAKTLSAYHRTIQSDDVPREKAEEILIKMKADPGKSLSADAAKQFQDFLFYKILSLCEKYDLPIQIHTGIQTFNGNILANTDPLLLTNTIMRFPKVKFILLHSGYPFGGETAALAKMFTNVYIDMTWTPLISPSYALRYLQEYIETVPQNKIMAFGGDCNTVEGTYSASILARDVVVQTLITMARSGYLSEEEAIVLARKILRENAINIYKLDFLK